MTTRSSRPQAVIDTEVDLTREAIRVCDRLVDVALAERRTLLDAGWPTTHGFCQALDEVAMRWTGERDVQARALRGLLAEYGPNDAKVTP